MAERAQGKGTRRQKERGRGGCIVLIFLWLFTKVVVSLASSSRDVDDLGKINMKIIRKIPTNNEERYAVLDIKI